VLALRSGRTYETNLSAGKFEVKQDMYVLVHICAASETIQIVKMKGENEIMIPVAGFR